MPTREQLLSCNFFPLNDIFLIDPIEIWMKKKKIKKVYSVLYEKKKVEISW